MSEINIQEKHKIEREFHNQKVLESDAEPHFEFYKHGALDYANRYSEKLLGDLTNKRLLDYGSGTGLSAIKFAQQGSNVLAFDISFESIKIAKRVACENKFDNRIYCCVMAGESLSLKSESFDFIYGHSILHHLDLEIALPEISRMLRKDGHAIFLEPLDTNPVIKIFRKLTPSKRTPTEKPFTFKQISELNKYFTEVHHREFYFISLLAYLWNFVFRNNNQFRAFLNQLTKIDDLLLKWIPLFRYFCWITVLDLRK